ncbi:NNP family nitrate/nitrite transporter-like MFS transporter [Agromyces flavus]|uniref:MFS transporter, NNP family, nitrate/nitrite transporter n=1 Tax=Agromyces flavus TaxID=589382 RepID=A0A1H1WL30_9MICO|nr:MFS transporter [Agromyces flavus]MCP2366200.1 NNP family nitrate/nitrite transporter-like MFS transporter [Agromyces flavus]GGI44198.1 MFS transporter [Agromyces flavus]SDS97853.1 MFS transporter, NNP family, nitrate/nitrite transporter [Agromyces flavus]
MTEASAKPTSEITALPGRGLNLGLALLAFAITFWAWNLIAPLAVRYADGLGLDAAQTSVLIATPVLVGSLGRILTGALTDRFGGRTMFTILTAVSAVPVLLVMYAGQIGSYPLLIAFGFLLGIAGTTFAVGIPFVNAWYEPSKRGFATGLFGAGMGGTALSSFFTPRMVAWFGYTATHLIIAVALLVVAATVWVFMRDAPTWKPNTDRVMPKLVAASKLAVTWQMAFLYAVTFGGFVAFSTYLPTYLKEVYGFDLADAGARTAGFAIAAVISRPVGGWLSDRIGPAKVLGISLAGAAVMAVVIALKPPPELLAGSSFVLMAVFLGLGTGAVFTWVAQRAPAERVGTVTGIVGAAGGLGGFFPPLVMGATYNAETHSYTIGLLLLCATALAALAFTFLLARRDRARA